MVDTFAVMGGELGTRLTPRSLTEETLNEWASDPVLGFLLLGPVTHQWMSSMFTVSKRH